MKCCEKNVLCSERASSVSCLLSDTKLPKYKAQTAFIGDLSGDFAKSEKYQGIAKPNNQKYYLSNIFPHVYSERRFVCAGICSI